MGKQKSKKNEQKSLKKQELITGKVFNFCGCKWRVLEVLADRALIISLIVFEKRPYNTQDTDVTWETCTLRKYLNGEFLQRFTAEEQSRIIEVNITNNGNLWYETAGAINTDDKIFLFSLEEADWYFGNSGDYQNKCRKTFGNGKWDMDVNGRAFSNNHNFSRYALFNGYQRWWWLRSPGSDRGRAAAVGSRGHVFVDGIPVGDNLGGVRPALWLSL